VEQIPLPPPVAPLFIFPPPPLHFVQFLNSFWVYLHLPTPPPPPPQEPPVFEPEQMLQDLLEETLPVEVEQVLEDQVEVQVEDEEEEIHVVESDGDDDEIVFVGEIAAPERRRRRARRVRDDDDEYVVESVLDRRYFHGVENFLIEWSGYGPEEKRWELGYEKRVESPEAIALYFQNNGIADDGIMILRSRDEEFVEDRQPRERPFLARAAKRPRFS
jgi:hypothetical protein